MQHTKKYVKSPIMVQLSLPPQKKPWLKRILPPTLITLGSLMLANVAWPIVSYQIINAPQLQRTQFIAPVAQEKLANNQPTSQPPPAQAPQVMGVELDYTDAKNWFPSAPFDATNQAKTYSISIPELNIEDADVVIGGEELDESLIHYPGTALPGQLGSPVVFGHSVLRQFYNPSINNPNRYVSIFSKIMTLDTGDHIFVNYDNVRYTYEVKDKVEVQPEDLFILEQRYSNKELKLITCVPEGTYLRRGVVIAQLVNLN